MHTPKQQQKVVSESGTESDSDEYMYPVNDNQNTDEGQPNKVKVGSMNTRSNGQIKVTAFVKETPFQAIADTGCTIDLIDSQTFNRIEKKWPDLCLKPTKTRAFPYNCEKPIKLLGKFETVVENNNNEITVTTIYVAAGNSGCLLKSKTAEELGFITVHVNKIAKHSVHDTNANQDITVSNSDTENIFTHPDANINELLLKHQQVFKANGCLKDHLVELDTDTSFKPVIQPQRIVPFHMRKLVENELIKLQEEDIIESAPSDEGTPWVSPAVVVPKKSGQIRLCIDMRAPNRAIQRVCHLMPTVEDVKVELNNARYFTMLDLREAHHQLVLHTYNNLFDPQRAFPL